MARSTAILMAVGAVCGAEARKYSEPKHSIKMKQRTRPIKDEQALRVDTLHTAMKDLRLDVLPDSLRSFETTYSTPTAESEAYYAYPLTLDYVVDVYFQNGTDGGMLEYPVIVDTGSSNLAVAVESCTNCESGSTGLELGWYGESDDSGELCIDVTYGSGSWDGMMTDQVKVGFVSDDTELVDDVYLAGITSQDGFFCGGFYGILGLAYSGLTESYSTCTTSSSSSGGSSSGGNSMGGGGQSRGGQSRGGQTSGRSGSSGHVEPQHQQHQQSQSARGAGSGVRASPQAAPASGHAQPSAHAETQTRESRSMPAAGHAQPQAHAETQTRAANTPSHPRRTSAVSAEELEASATLTSTPLLDSFYEDGLVEDNVFSILFCGDLASMAVGGVDTTQVSSADSQGLTFVDTQKTYDQIYGYFLVEVESVAVDGTTVSTDSTDLNEIGGVLVDSGTTLIYLPSEVTSAIETKVESQVTSLESSFFQWSSCVEESELENFPNITLGLSGYNLNLSPYQYLLWYSDCYYWGISSSSIPIIGNVALQGKLVVFDKETNQIGFAEGDCSDYGGTSFDNDDSAESKTAKDAVVPRDEGVTEEGMSSQVLAAVQGTASQMSGQVVAGAALVVLGVAFVVARGRGKKYASVPEADDELSI